MTTTKKCFEKDYKSVVEMLQFGYGPHLKAALWDCVVRYLPSMVREGIEPGEPALDAHWTLCELFERLMRDEYGIDLYDPEPTPSPSRGEGSDDSQPVEELTIDN